MDDRYYEMKYFLLQLKWAGYDFQSKEELIGYLKEFKREDIISSIEKEPEIWRDYLTWF